MLYEALEDDLPGLEAQARDMGHLRLSTLTIRDRLFDDETKHGSETTSPLFRERLLMTREILRSMRAIADRRRHYSSLPDNYQSLPTIGLGLLAKAEWARFDYWSLFCCFLFPLQAQASRSQPVEENIIGVGTSQGPGHRPITDRYYLLAVTQ